VSVAAVEVVGTEAAVQLVVAVQTVEEVAIVLVEGAEERLGALVVAARAVFDCHSCPLSDSLTFGELPEAVELNKATLNRSLLAYGRVH
jgi:hypothetical protein